MRYKRRKFEDITPEIKVKLIEDFQKIADEMASKAKGMEKKLDRTDLENYNPGVVIVYYHLHEKLALQRSVIDLLKKEAKTEEEGRENLIKASRLFKRLQNYDEDVKWQEEMETFLDGFKHGMEVEFDRIYELYVPEIEERVAKRTYKLTVEKLLEKFNFVPKDK